MKISELKRGDKFKFTYEGSLIYKFDGKAGSLNNPNELHHGTHLNWIRLSDDMQVLLPDHLNVIKV